MEAKIHWYDSVWLNKYLDAKELISRICPSKLDEFVGRFNVLRTRPDFMVKELKELLNPEKLAMVRNTINKISMNKMELHEVKRFGRFVVHDHPVFLKMQAELTDMVSELAEEDLEPCYNFLSLYTRLGICEPHMDAPSAKWTLDICIDQSEPWPIHFSQIVAWPEVRRDLGLDWQQAIKNDPELRFESKILEPGNAIFFAGSSQYHYRDALPQTSTRGFCNLLFFHYIPKGTGELIKSKNWARLFDVPELAEITGIENGG